MTVTMIAAAIVLLGVFAFPRLPVNLLPSFQPPVVSVTVNYGNVAPETMESTVTRPIENAVARVSGIDYLQSDSYQGQTQVRAVFKYGVDINVASTDIQQQIARVSNQLPNDPNLQQPQILKADPNSLPVVFMYVTDTQRTQRELNDLFANSLNDEFSAIQGVGSAGVSGGQTRAIMVEPDQNVLAGYGLTNSTIIQKIAGENVDFPAGIIAIGPNEFGVRTSALFKSANQIAAIVVAIKNGAPIYLGDVARVSDSISEQRIFARLDGIPAIRVGINAQPDANVVAVAGGVYAKIAQLQRRYPTMHFQPVLEQRGFILEAVTALEHTAIYGAILAILIILLFLHSWRSTLIVAVSLPVSVMGTFFAAFFTHQTLNTMTLGGLALAVGLIVDDAVVVIENIFRHLDRGEAPKDAARDATTQIFSAVASSSITVITVFVPLLLIPGLQGLIFGPFALTVMTAVAISLLVAVTTVPMMASIFLKSSDAHATGQGFAARFDRQYERFENWYRGLLGWSVDHPGIVLGAGLVLLALTFALVKLGVVQTEVFPASDSRYARFDVRLPNGTALERTNHVSTLVEAAFRRDPRVVAVGATVGSAFGGGTSRQITNQMSLSVILRPEIYGSAATAFVNDWQRRLGGAPRSAAGLPPPSPAPGATPIPPQIVAQRRALRSALVGTTVRGRTIDILQQQIAQGADALQIQIYGGDITRLYDLAHGAISQLAQIQGVIRPDTNINAKQPEVDVKIDRRKAAQYGLSTAEIASDIATATSGTIASYFQINGVQYPILVEAPAQQRRSLASIANLQIVPPVNTQSASTQQFLSGASHTLGSISLGSVAQVTTGVGPSQISRQNKQRRIDINATVIGRPLGEVVVQAQKIMEAYPLPAGYRWQFGPAITQNQDTFSALGLVVLLAVLLIYMLLASQFESFLDPLVIMMSVPFAVIGIVASLLLTHRAFGLTAFIGSLMLVGIAVKNAILVIEFTKQLRRQGMDPREALMHAGPLRLRPILMTTFATAGGMLPLALGLEAGSTTQAPLGTVVVGGLVTSTMLSLLVVPTLYLWTVRHVESRFGEAKPPKIFPRTRRRAPIVAREPAGV
ncbi:MAG: efflux RND transporter permease subunit [Candidatus Eremiobacteraeota bacterium]|nr:efflux RND transporter permease subunit [Candidatus Eremiobacteraeota bacterium]